MVLPIRNQKSSTRQGSSDTELHCSGVIITVIMNDKTDSLVYHAMTIHDAYAEGGGKQ